ncbi:MAG: Cupin 2 conserved barrel domain protein [Verrucomicrobiales bacterium]|nr:Cupin 2 conserved barrel domain protein [Verrucomicrobiales bacterium]
MNTRFVTKENLQHGDYPWCHVELMCNPETVGAGKLLLVRATMPAGEAHNFHKHPAREEIIYVIEGQAEQWVGEQKRLLKPGEMAHIPANLPHATFNPGPGTLVFLAILSPVEAPGEFTVDVFNEEPWRTLRPPLPYAETEMKRTS